MRGALHRKSTEGFTHIYIYDSALRLQLSGFVFPVQTNIFQGGGAGEVVHVLCDGLQPSLSGIGLERGGEAGNQIWAEVKCVQDDPAALIDTPLL